MQTESLSEHTHLLAALARYAQQHPEWQAYVLMDGISTSELMERLGPIWAEHILLIPDPYYEKAPDTAPHLLSLPPLHAEAMQTDTALQSLLSLLLTQAVAEAGAPLQPHPMCAWLWSPAPSHELAYHLARLSKQAWPDERFMLFRYQDPRVMQRVWPYLHDIQRDIWLGPIQSWWSVPQHGGALPNELTISAQWWCSHEHNTQAEDTFALTAQPLQSRHDLALTRQQWYWACSAPAENLFYQRLHGNDVPIAQQPPLDTARDWLLQAHRLGLSADDCAAYAWFRWQCGETAWNTPDMKNRLMKALSQQRKNQGLDFESAWIAQGPLPVAPPPSKESHLHPLRSAS